MVDILFCFRTAYNSVTNDSVIVIPRKIGVQYIRTWFLIDLISTIPFGFITSMAGSNSNATATKILRIVRIFRLFRLFKIFKLQEYIFFVKEFIRFFSIWDFICTSCQSTA
jgi:hypothetical protein